MFAQVYESEKLQYRLPADVTGFMVSKLLTPSNPYLVDPPRLYGERIYFLNGLFVQQEKTPTANHVVHVLCNMEIYWYPGHTMRHLVFDGATGKYLRDDPATNSVSSYDLVEGADGSLWISDVFGWRELDPITMKFITGIALDNSKYGSSGNMVTPMIDRVNNILMRSDVATNLVVKIYDFETGAFIRDMDVSGRVSQIIPESSQHAYVYCDNGMLCLIDYVNGRVLSAFKAPAPTDTLAYTFTGRQKFAYDRFSRRLLACQMMADNEDGSSNTLIKGWYPVPLPVGITHPIPIEPPRKNKTIRYLTRLYGDAGEPVAGAYVNGEMSGVTASITPGITDNNGYAIVQAKASTSGSATLIVTAEVTSA